MIHNNNKTTYLFCNIRKIATKKTIVKLFVNKILHMFMFKFKNLKVNSVDIVVKFNNMKSLNFTNVE